MSLDNKVQVSRYPIDIIIGGVDQFGGHIFGVRDPGVVSCYDGLGYHSIGSGETHALLHLTGINYHHTKDFNNAVYDVYEAKKHAELAQGVGDATEIRVIGSEGIHTVTADEKELLRKIYDQKVTPRQDEISEEINKLPFRGAN